MTLRTNGNYIYHDHHNTMSSANTRVAADARIGTNGFKTIYLGKDQRPISVMKLALLEEPSWKRGATFTHLAKAIKSQMKNYTMADLVTVVANEMPISTESAMEEAEGAGERLRKEIFCVDNLEGQHFLDSKGKQKDVTSEELSLRPGDLSYFAFLCNVNPKEVDKRIVQEQLSISFSLKLPLSLYDTSKDMVVEELWKRSSRKADRKGAVGLGKLIGQKGNQDEYESVQKALFQEDKDKGYVGSDEEKVDGQTDDEDGDTSQKTPKQRNNTGLGQISAVTSPKMSRLLGSQSTKVVSGYYGPFTFLDNQKVFDDTFGVDPMLLASKPLLKAEALREQVEEFIDSCKLDVFMASCRNYYVGVGNKESEVQAMNAACKTIGELRMEYKVNNRIVQDNPDVLFGKFMEVTPLLPDDASKWSTQLCSAYFNALTEDLKAKMENDDFRMPALNNLNNKKEQIDALQIVREKSSTAYKKLNDETKLIKQIMQSSGVGAPRRTGVQFVTEAVEDFSRKI